MSFFSDTTSAPKVTIRGANWIDEPVFYGFYPIGVPLPSKVYRTRAIREFEFRGLTEAAAQAITQAYNFSAGGVKSSASYRRTDKSGHFAVVVYQDTSSSWIVSP